MMSERLAQLCPSLKLTQTCLPHHIQQQQQSETVHSQVVCNTFKYIIVFNKYYNTNTSSLLHLMMSQSLSVLWGSLCAHIPRCSVLCRLAARQCCRLLHVDSGCVFSIQCITFDQGPDVVNCVVNRVPFEIQTLTETMERSARGSLLQTHRASSSSPLQAARAKITQQG